MYMRGNPRDYDTWAELTEDPEWNYENVLPFFKKLEDFHGYEYPGVVLFIVYSNVYYFMSALSEKFCIYFYYIYLCLHKIFLEKIPHITTGGTDLCT